jgi:hypothetical protein
MDRPATDALPARTIQQPLAERASSEFTNCPKGIGCAGTERRAVAM